MHCEQMPFRIVAQHGVDCLRGYGVNSIESTFMLLQSYSVRSCYVVLQSFIGCGYGMSGGGGGGGCGVCVVGKIAKDVGTAIR